MDPFGSGCSKTDMFRLAIEVRASSVRVGERPRSETSLAAMEAIAGLRAGAPRFDDLGATLIAERAEAKRTP
jgi:hypothetical protein